MRTLKHMQLWSVWYMKQLKIISKVVLSCLNLGLPLWRNWCCHGLNWWLLGFCRLYNRIAEIHELPDPNLWRHCEVKVNRADLITKWRPGKQLQHSQKWWSGPDYLSLPESQRTRVKIIASQLPDVAEEQSSAKAANIFPCIIKTNTDKASFLNLAKYSSLTRLYCVEY